MKYNDSYKTGKNVNIGARVKIGDRTVIHDNVTIAADTIIANDCTIGEPLNDSYHNPKYKNPATHIGSNSLIRSHTILYAGSTFGDHLTTGHHATVRERTVMGVHCMVGTLCDIQGTSTFGDYCRLHSGVFICPDSRIGNFVMIFPHAVLTNDPTPPSNVSRGPIIGDYSVICARALILPDVTIGTNSVVGAGSVVVRDVADYTLVVGSPAKSKGDVRQIKSRQSDGVHYPWRDNFKRGMPWEKTGK